MYKCICYYICCDCCIAGTQQTIQPWCSRCSFMARLYLIRQYVSCALLNPAYMGYDVTRAHTSTQPHIFATTPPSYYYIHGRRYQKDRTPYIRGHAEASCYYCHTTAAATATRITGTGGLNVSWKRYIAYENDTQHMKAMIHSILIRSTVTRSGGT